MSDWISILNGNSGAIIAIATVVLVLVTLAYACLTHKTVKEMQKAREIAFIRDQLEKFYYPLQSFVDSYVMENSLNATLAGVYKY